jgi:hypothetical protein
MSSEQDAAQSASLGKIESASRQGGLVTEGDFLRRMNVPGFAAQPFAHNRAGVQRKPPARENKHFNTSHNVTMSTNQVLFLQDTYRRESMSRVFWDGVYGKTHGPGSTKELRGQSMRPTTAPNMSDVVRPVRSQPEYKPTYIEKRRKLLDLCYNSNLVLGTTPDKERFSTTYGELCSEAGSTKDRLDAIKGFHLTTASIKHYDVFTHRQSLDPMFGKTRFPITSSPGITEFKGPRDANAIRAWHEFSTINYR